MLLAEITRKAQSLPRVGKVQLIEALSKILLEEENPGRYFVPGSVYPIFTPDHQEKAAGQLQQFLSETSKTYYLPTPYDSFGAAVVLAEGLAGDQR
jgi:hypothetical protein